MPLSRPLSHLAAALTAAGVAVFAAAGPAAAGTTTTTTPAKGTATSTVTLLHLTVAGTTVTTGRIDLVADDATSPHQAKVVVTPLDCSLSMCPVGQQTVTPSSSPSSIPAPSTSVALPGGVGSVSGPAASATAADDATQVVATAAATALGTVDLLGLPLDLRTTSLADAARVTSTAASAQKTLSVGTIALPSLADLLDAQGLDLAKLLAVLDQADLVKLAGIVTDTATGAVATANGAVDAAQSALTSAGDTAAGSLSAADAQLTQATAAATDAQDAFTSEWTSAYGALAAPAKTTLDAALTTAGLSSPLTADQLLALDPTALAAVTTAFGAGEVTTLTTLAQAAQTAEQAVTLVNNLVDALQALVDAVSAALTSDTDPLASLGSLKLVTSAVAAATPTADAALTVGSVDVLGVATGVADLAGTLGGAMTTLTDVLATAGVTFTPPTIAFGTPTHSTSRTGTTRHATATVTGITVTLPSLSAPAALTLTGVPVSTPTGSLTVGQLAEVAQWTPSVTTTSTTPGSPSAGTPSTTGTPSASDHPALAGTGGSMVVPVVASVLLGVGLAARRRWLRAGSPTG